MTPAPRAWLAPCAALLGLLAAGCAAASQPCDQLNACPGALVCQVGRCASLDALPVRPESGRKLLEPTDALFLDGASHEGTTSEARAGSEAGGGSLLLLRFDPSSWSAQQLERAYLILTPVEGAPASPSTIELLASPILSPWDSRSPSPLPRLGPPQARALTSFAPPRVARIDVTDLLKEWAQRKDATFGLALRLSASGDLGGRFGWDDAHGTGPRLDIYLR